VYKATDRSIGTETSVRYVPVSLVTDHQKCRTNLAVECASGSFLLCSFYICSLYRRNKLLIIRRACIAPGVNARRFSVKQITVDAAKNNNCCRYNM
jgi:hypothetical protein